MKWIKAACRKKRRAWCPLFLIGMITLLCFARAFYHAEFLKVQMSKLDFTASGLQGGMDYAGARSAWEENRKRTDPLEYVNWTQADGVQVSASGLGTVEECDVLLLCGRSDLLFPGYAVLDSEAQNGCLISSALSGKLFGGEDTKGLTVETGGRKLEILDVIDSKESFLVYEAGENDPYSFERAAVNCISGEIGKTAENYQQLCGGWERMESRVFVWITQGVCFLIPCILWIFLMYYCAGMIRVVKVKRMERADRIEKMSWTLLLYLLLAGGILLLVWKVQIPEDMIPTKWSDFNFWEEYREKFSASCRILIRSEKKIPDIQMLKEFVSALKWAMAAILSEVVFLIRFRKI